MTSKNWEWYKFFSSWYKKVDSCSCYVKVEYIGHKQYWVPWLYGSCLDTKEISKKKYKSLEAAKKAAERIVKSRFKVKWKVLEVNHSKDTIWPHHGTKYQAKFRDYNFILFVAQRAPNGPACGSCDTWSVEQMDGGMLFRSNIQPIEYEHGAPEKYYVKQATFEVEKFLRRVYDK